MIYKNIDGFREKENNKSLNAPNEWCVENFNILTINGHKFVNLCPHDYHIEIARDVVLTAKAQDGHKYLRADTHYLSGSLCGLKLNRVKHVVRKECLPPKVNGITYIVSRITATGIVNTHSDRTDFIYGRKRYSSTLNGESVEIIQEFGCVADGE